MPSRAFRARHRSLERLDDVVVGALVESAVAAGLPRWDAAALAAESEGLPLYVVEALMAGPGADGHGPPRGVRALLHERLSTVSGTAGQVLAAAAVIGRSFDFGTVRAASGRAEDETVTALEELVRRGIVRELAGTGEPAFDFGHARLRDAAYEGIGMARRRLLHRRVADALRADAAGPTTRAASPRSQVMSGRRVATRPPQRRTARPDSDRGGSTRTGRRWRISRWPSRSGIRTSQGCRWRSARCGPRSAITRERLRHSRRPRASCRTRCCRRSSCGWARSTRGAGMWPPPRATWMRRSRAPTTGSGRPCWWSGERSHSGRTSWTRPSRSRRTALDAIAGTDDARTTGAASRLLGLVALRRGDLDAAREALRRAVAAADQSAEPGASIAARNGLALVEAAAGDRGPAIAAARGGPGRVPADGRDAPRGGGREQPRGSAPCRRPHGGGDGSPQTCRDPVRRGRRPAGRAGAGDLEARFLVGAGDGRMRPAQRLADRRQPSGAVPARARGAPTVPWRDDPGAGGGVRCTNWGSGVTGATPGARSVPLCALWGVRAPDAWTSRRLQDGRGPPSGPGHAPEPAPSRPRPSPGRSRAPAPRHRHPPDPCLRAGAASRHRRPGDQGFAPGPRSPRRRIAGRRRPKRTRPPPRRRSGPPRAGRRSPSLAASYSAAVAPVNANDDRRSDGHNGGAHHSPDAATLAADGLDVRERFR